MRYRGPANDDYDNPSLEWLHTIIFERGADYWQKGAGDSGLWPESGQPLIFFYEHPHGFYLGFFTDGDVEVVPYDGTPCDETVTHYVGGEPMRRPRACFVSREQAWDVIREFVLHGRRSPTFKWVGIADLEFDTGHETT